MNRIRLAFSVLVHGLPAPSPTAPAAPAAPAATAARVEPHELPDEQSPAVPAGTAQLIDLRDQLALGLDEQDQAVARALTTVDRRLLEILALQGVEAFEDDGCFDPDRHNVVSSMETGDPEQHYRLASTVRPGYLRAGRLHRRQDVIVYRMPAEHAGVPG